MGKFRWTAWALLVAMLALSGCAQLAKQDTPVAGATFRLANDPLSAPWQAVHIRFKTPTSYTRAEVEGVPCILADAQGTWSLQAAAVPPAQALGSVLSWRWFVPTLPVGADNELSSKDDAAVRVLISFKGDRSKINAADRSAMNMAKLIGGWEIPYATIQYIWEPDAAPETIIDHHTISRIKKMVVRSGERGLANWVNLERNVRDDFRRAFPGEEPGDIESIGIMTDSDTLGGHLRACYADVQLR
jgi:Protein of unknown function (DUF3047)